MNQNQRQRRVRLLVKNVNKERKRQAGKIDILCNDLITAQRDFMRRLGGVGFAASFYKSLLGLTDPRRLLTRAAQSIQEELPGTNVCFFLRRSEGIGLRVAHQHQKLLVDDRPLEDCFNPDLVESICKANKCCTVDEIFGMGLEANLNGLKQISLATLPLSDLSRSLGFVLLSRSISRPLSAAELGKIGLVTCGLSRALAACRSPLRCEE